MLPCVGDPAPDQVRADQLEQLSGRGARGLATTGAEEAARVVIGNSDWNLEQPAAPAARDGAARSFRAHDDLDVARSAVRWPFSKPLTSAATDVDSGTRATRPVTLAFYETAPDAGPRSDQP